MKKSVFALTVVIAALGNCLSAQTLSKSTILKVYSEEGYAYQRAHYKNLLKDTNDVDMENKNHALFKSDSVSLASILNAFGNGDSDVTALDANLTKSFPYFKNDLFQQIKLRLFAEYARAKSAEAGRWNKLVCQTPQGLQLRTFQIRSYVLFSAFTPKLQGSRFFYAAS